ncbi:hypothetical protein LTR56_028162 [Elasticomyces elasticus]|nr:hypothetical protein LTR56_028162 [Elasticomyces elasticus]KAK3613027.1 hypothetical protein LTR22_028340 [Elasticomyces elasticus]KAK4889785.1 hypothetical protein LTR49_028773 [Elasticomyces elasticus]KAK5704640.1 hypothetical protein LTS12_028287 [Elasticomyces elasticus]
MKRLHPTFHVSLLEPYKARQGYQPPPVDDLDDTEVGEIDVDDGEKYEIEKIVTHFFDKTEKRRKYKVRWLGWDASRDSDMLLEELEGAQDLLSEYLESKNLNRDETGDAPMSQKGATGTRERPIREARSSGNVTQEPSSRAAPSSNRDPAKPYQAFLLIAKNAEDSIL